MGLDVYAYQKLKMVDQPKELEPFIMNNLSHRLWVKVYSNPSFPRRAFPFKTGELWVSDIEALHFSVTYGQYSDWRDAMCRKFLGTRFDYFLKHPNEFKRKPFFKLLWFADNEGVLGTPVCRSLLIDFSKHSDKASKVFEGSHLATYQYFHRALKFASDDGLIQFH